jgi:hypothetical protein
VSKSTGRFFLIQAPKCEESDETPPAILDEKEDILLDYDGLLGLYEMGPPRITIYKKAIESVANKRGYFPEHLKHLVDIHEWGHALHHLGSFEPASDEEFMNSRNAERYRATSDELKEQIAQLATLLTVRESAQRVRSEEAKTFYEELENMFFDLMSRQSAKYKLPDFVRGFTVTRLREKLQLLFRISDCPLSLEDVAGILK